MDKVCHFSELAFKCIICETSTQGCDSIEDLFSLHGPLCTKVSFQERERFPFYLKFYSKELRFKTYNTHLFSNLSIIHQLVDAHFIFDSAYCVFNPNTV